MKVQIRLSGSAHGWYRASCPALPGCVVWGPSPAEARQKLNEAIRGYVSSIAEALPRELARLGGVS